MLAVSLKLNKTDKKVKQVLAILIFSFFISSCCGLVCEREKHAEMIIEKVEVYIQKTGRLPENVTEAGINDEQDTLSFYVKKSEDEYEIWYGLGLGTSRIYNSKTKKWREEG
jgi:hypothetical protein